LSTTLDQPYIQAAFTLRPTPPSMFTADSVTPLLAEMHMALFDPRTPPTAAGAIAVLSNDDTAPSGAEPLFTEQTVAVYRLR
jgi:hypothetical protein